MVNPCEQNRMGYFEGSTFGDKTEKKHGGKTPEDYDESDKDE